MISSKHVPVSLIENATEGLGILWRANLNHLQKDHALGVKVALTY